MYLYEIVEKKDLHKEAVLSPFGPKFDEKTVAKAEKMEVWVSKVKDQGDNFFEFRLISADGKVIETRKVKGR